MAYYTKIKGKNYDKELLDLAKKLTDGKGDGRISTDDSKKLLAAVKDAGSYTDVEKRTMEYIRDKFSFTEAADTFFRTEIRKWAASKPAAAKGRTPVVAKPVAKKKAIAAVKKPAAKPATLISSTTKSVEKKNDEIVNNPSALISKDPKVENVKPFPWWIILLLALLFILFLMFRFGCISNQNSLNNAAPKINTNLPTPNKVEIPAKKTAEIQKFIPEMRKEDISKLQYSFQKKSTDINQETKTSLSSLAEYLKKNPNSKLKIIGHSCDLGSDQLNQKYSVLRATKVKSYLNQIGIKNDRLKIEGKGESEPIAPNDIEENRQKNRRVQFILE